MNTFMGRSEFQKPANHAVRTFSSPFLTVSLRLSRQANSVPSHWHDYDEFIYSPNGLNRLSWTTQERTIVKELLPTTVLWTPAGVRHSAKWDSSWYSAGILLSKEFLDSYLLQSNLWRPETTVFINASEELNLLLKLAVSQTWLERIISIPAFARSAAVVLSSELADSYTASAGARDISTEKVPLGKLNDYIDANLARDLSLRDLADVANLSPHHFSRLFKNSTGCSPYQYLVSRRLRHALSLVSSSELAMDEIAKSTGFSSASSFAKAFKRVYRVSPSEYRRKLASE